jgi:polysaccharide biosynthesis transport protein
MTDLLPWHFARRWWWLLVLVTTLAVVVGYVVSERLPRVYEGTTKLLVTPGQADGAASYNDVLAGERLTRTYAEVLKTRPIVQAAAQQVGLGLAYDEAIRLVDVKPLRDTQLIQISARADDPDLAVQFANHLASVFIASDQVVQLSRVAVAEAATRQETPVEPRVMLNVLFAGVVGLIVSLATALVGEQLDDRLTSPERLTRLVGLPALGSVAAFPADAPRTIDRIADARAATPGDTWRTAGWAEESYRLLFTNLSFATADAPQRTLLVTSSQDGEGKSLTAANLAVVIAQTGQRVVLVEADLRRPSLGQLFGVQSGVGLTSLLVDQQQATAAALRPTRVQGLSLLPSGPRQPNPSELLASHRMRDRLAELRELCDLVILDSPPVLPVSDPAVLARLVDGTLLVVDARRSRARATAESVQRLRQAGALVLGAVLNGVTATNGDYYYARPATRRQARSSLTAG